MTPPSVAVRRRPGSRRQLLIVDATHPTLDCRTSPAIASPRGSPTLRRRVLSPPRNGEASQIGGGRVEDDHVDRLAAASRHRVTVSSRSIGQLLSHFQQTATQGIALAERQVICLARAEPRRRLPASGPPIAATSSVARKHPVVHARLGNLALRACVLSDACPRLMISSSTPEAYNQRFCGRGEEVVVP